ncbi:MAG: hypothetical protein ACAI44_39110 [Candidatus Sericytochromatia bacterium]
MKLKSLFSGTLPFPFNAFGLVLLVVLTIGGLILLPFFIPSQDEMTRPTNIASMHTLQTLVETYGQEHRGIYPTNLKQLYAHASQPSMGYWKEIENPYTGAKGIGPKGAIADLSPDMLQPVQWLWFSFDATHKELAGLAVYQPQGSPPNNYTIHSFDKHGKLQRRDGKLLVMSAEP